MRQIVVRETVEVPVQAEPEREINLPIELLKGMWFAERRRLEMEEAQKERRERTFQYCLLAGLVAGIVAICYLFGGM